MNVFPDLTTVFPKTGDATQPVEELHDRAHPERDREKSKREAKTQRCRTDPDGGNFVVVFFRMEDSISMIG